MRPGLRWPVYLALGLAMTAAGAGEQPVIEGMRRCAHEADEHQRLACFDELAHALPQITTDQFGMTGAIQRKRSPAAAASTERESIHGKIAARRPAPGERWVYTLDSGQQWTEVESRPGVRIEVGDAVEIGYGAFDSLWLKADHHRQVRVKRVQ